MRAGRGTTRRRATVSDAAARAQSTRALRPGAGDFRGARRHRASSRRGESRGSPPSATSTSPPSVNGLNRICSAISGAARISRICGTNSSDQMAQGHDPPAVVDRGHNAGDKQHQHDRRRSDAADDIHRSEKAADDDQHDSCDREDERRPPSDFRSAALFPDLAHLLVERCADFRNGIESLFLVVRLDLLGAGRVAVDEERLHERRFVSRRTASLLLQQRQNELVVLKKPRFSTRLLSFPS